MWPTIQSNQDSNNTASVDIIYQCDEFIVANKPPWLLSVPGRKPDNQDSLFTRVKQLHPSASVVHRLDCATSGLMIFPLSKAIERHISIQFQQRSVRKIYIAIGHGESNETEGLIDCPIIVDWPNRPRQKVDWDKGKPAQTRWQVIERENQCTRFKLMPITGRSHQLRVHLRELGFPIIGDRLYAPPKVAQQSGRLLLHAEQIEFKHPISNQVLNFYSQCPF